MHILNALYVPLDTASAKCLNVNVIPFSIYPRALFRYKVVARDVRKAYLYNICF